MSDAQTGPQATIDYGERGIVRVYPDGEALARAAADVFAESAANARGHAFIALSGGSTPKRMGQLLAEPPYRDTIDWRNIEFFWGDERYVPEESPESNAGEARRILLDKVDADPARINPFPTTVGDVGLAAEMYATQIRTVFGETDGMPSFDLVFLGMGDDGHTLSLFPGTSALAETERLVVANPVEKLDTVRLTMTAPLVNAARRVVFLVGGAGKAERLAEVLDGPIETDRLPAQLIRPKGGELIWLVDAAAAARLTRDGESSGD
ncbi:MAG TPA: 6-phosphogluconolactonase [Thermomicrobiales bacterium]|nr:6-phosphogluconolactonase [Thermomicrobiales bacterium]